VGDVVGLVTFVGLGLVTFVVGLGLGLGLFVVAAVGATVEELGDVEGLAEVGVVVRAIVVGTIAGIRVVKVAVVVVEALAEGVGGFWGVWV